MSSLWKKVHKQVTRYNPRVLSAFHLSNLSGKVLFSFFFFPSLSRSSLFRRRRSHYSKYMNRIVIKRNSFFFVAPHFLRFNSSEKYFTFFLKGRMKTLLRYLTFFLCKISDATLKGRKSWNSDKENQKGSQVLVCDPFKGFLLVERQWIDFPWATSTLLYCIGDNQSLLRCESKFSLIWKGAM